MLSGDKYKIKYHRLAGAEEDKAAFDRLMKQTGIGIPIANIVKDHPQIVNMKDDNGDTPLHHVAKEGWVYLVQDILEEKPELLYIRNKDGKTPLNVAMKNKKVSVVEILSAAMKTGCGVCNS
jgi:hypothetical protein